MASRAVCALLGDQTLARHLRRLRQAHQREHRRRDVRQPPAAAHLRLAAAKPSPTTNTSTRFSVCAVCGPLSVGSHICSPLPWSAQITARPPTFSKRVEQLADAAIGRLHRLDRRRQRAGVADHVGVGEVHDDQAVLAGQDRRLRRRASPRAPTSPAAGRRSPPSGSADTRALRRGTAPCGSR